MLERNFIYNEDKRFAPFPTYPVALPLKGKPSYFRRTAELSLTKPGDSEDVNLFSEQVAGRGRSVPGLPRFDPNRVVRHLSSSLYAPISTLSPA